MKDFDENFDDFDFKPLTEGLGFHHSLQEKSKIKSSLRMQAESLKTDLDERAKRLLGDTHSDHSEQTVNHMGDLSPFYRDNSTNVDEIPSMSDISQNTTEYRYFDAPMSLRLKAWCVDLLVIFAMFAITIGSVFVFSDMPLDSLAKFMISSEIAPSLLAIYGMFYIFYFSTLDRTNYSTIGKNLFNLKMVGSYYDVSLRDSLLKSLLSLVSVLSMGMITMLSLTDQISKTRIVQK